jgi:hypothetical protein
VQGEGQRVEDVPDVHHEGGHGNGRQRGGGDHADEQELERSAEDERGGQARPPPVEAGLDDERPEGEAEREEAEADGDGVREGGTRLGYSHGVIL